MIDSCVLMQIAYYYSSSFNSFMQLVLSTGFSFYKPKHPLTHFSLFFLVSNWGSLL